MIDEESQLTKKVPKLLSTLKRIMSFLIQNSTKNVLFSEKKSLFPTSSLKIFDISFYFQVAQQREDEDIERIYLYIEILLHSTLLARQWVYSYIFLRNIGVIPLASYNLVTVDC